MAKSQRGFAGMDPAAQREIARAGGRAAHQSGHAHEFTPEEAAEAGRKGGRARHHKSALLHQDGAAHRQGGKSQEAGEMEAGQQHQPLIEHNGEATGFNREAGERTREWTPDRETFEGDGQAMGSSRGGLGGQSRERSPGMMTGARTGESGEQSRVQSAQTMRPGQQEGTAGEEMRRAAPGAETESGASEEAGAGDVELLSERDQQRTSAARRGPDSENEDED